MICFAKKLEFQDMKYALSAKGKQWRVGEVIDICFLEGTKEQRKYVKEIAEEWLKYANLKFKWDVPQDKSDVRISFRESMGSWSYVGTDSLFINRAQPTMNFGWLDKSTVLHEFGHMIGLLHEHQNPAGGIKWNVDKVIKALSGPPNNWDEGTIRHNVLNQATTDSANGTEFDPSSIMLYYFPDEWVEGGKGTNRNVDISETDKKYIAELYPFIDKGNNNVKRTGIVSKIANLFKK